MSKKFTDWNFKKIIFSKLKKFHVPPYWILKTEEKKHWVDAELYFLKNWKISKTWNREKCLWKMNQVKIIKLHQVKVYFSKKMLDWHILSLPVLCSCPQDLSFYYGGAFFVRSEYFLHISRIRSRSRFFKPLLACEPISKNTFSNRLRRPL